MAADHHLKKAVGTNVHLLQVMQHVNGNWSNFGYLPVRQILRPFTFVVVATNSDHRSNLSESFQDVLVANVPGVKNEVDTLECHNCFRPHQSMCVRDNPD